MIRRSVKIDLRHLLNRLRSRRPRTPEALWEFVRCYYGLWLPRRRVCPGHAAPFEYVAASYFQTHGDLVVWANRGGGKTELGSVTAHLDSIFHPHCQTRILGASLQQSERMYGYLSAKWHPLFADYLAEEPRSRSTTLNNGSTIEILTQSERSVRGQRVQRVKCDEVDEFDPDVWRAVQFVTQSGGGLRANIEAFSTMHRPYGLMSQVVDGAWNVAGSAGPAHDAARLPARQVGASGPGGVFSPAAAPRTRGPALLSWCLWETIERCTGDYSCSRCDLSEDCRGRAKEAEGFIQLEDALAQKRRSGREAWEAEMLCLRPRQEHLVFPRFSRHEHVRAVGYESTWPVYRALDFGFADPFVCLWAQVVGDDPETAVVRVLDEYVRAQRTVAEHARILQGRPWPVRATYCDPAGWQRGDVTGSGACHELARHGILTKSCTSGIMEGVDLLRALLAPAVGRTRLLVDPRCEHLIRALESYHYPPRLRQGYGGRARGNGSGAELPEKDGRHDHLLDALRYLVVNLFGRGRGAVRDTSYW